MIKSKLSRNYSAYLYIDGIFESVPSNDSSNFSIELQDFDDGVINFISFQCDSTNYGLSFHTVSECVHNKVTEIINVAEISGDVEIADWHVLFRNGENPIQRRLYVRIENNSSMNTGNISWIVGMFVNKRTVRT